jgi:tripartite-type tricarboxylate transporter receptor subunit TctC
MTTSTRNAAVTVFALSALLTMCPASADAPTYPAKPIRVIVNSSPGSPPDIVARIVGERLGPTLGQPVVVENRPGGIGTIALAAVARAEPDGHTLGTISPPHTIAPSLLTQMPYDTVRDLAPVRQINRASYLLLVRSGSPVRSLPELVAAAKAQPGRLTYASAGNGTPPHLAAELFKLHAAIDLSHVPYKGGAAAMAALLGEQVELAFATTSTIGPYLRSGKLRALATTGPARMPGFPDVPTLAELGYNGFDVRDWQGLVVPAKTPKPVIDRLAAEVARVLEQPETRERLLGIGMEPVADSGPEAFGALIQAELARWAKVVREAGIRAD